MESDIYGNTAMPLAPDLQNLQTPQEAANMYHFTDANAEIKSQLITGCLSEKVRQKELMDSNMLLGDLINYSKTTETITKHLEQMHLEDANSITKSTTCVNALVNKVVYEQQRPRKRLKQNLCRNCNGKYPHERGPCIPEPVCLFPEMGKFHLRLFQKTKRRG